MNEIRTYLFVIFFTVFFTKITVGQQKVIDAYNASQATIEERVYKQSDTSALTLKIYYPQKLKKNKKYPAMVFFFGGGWVGRNITQFEPHAQYFAARGMICIIADYRVKNTHGTSPFDAVEDAKSALRYIRSHAQALKIDPDRIVASGGSAGGHLAAATATIPGLDHADDDVSVSAKPNALVLFNPVFDNGPQGYGYSRIGDRYLEISPMHNITRGMPPAIVFLGTEDKLIPVKTAEAWKAKMDSVGSRCDIFIYEGQKHGFFNYKHSEYFNKTVNETDLFLQAIGYLKKKKR